MALFAQYGIIFLLSASLMFHFLVLLKVIPFSIVWGGRLKSEKEMARFEIVSILVNLLLLFLILVQADMVRIPIPRIIIKISLWLMVGLFALNTLGNIYSKNKLERKVFTPVTIVLTILSFILAINT